MSTSLIRCWIALVRASRSSLSPFGDERILAPARQHLRIRVESRLTNSSAPSSSSGSHFRREPVVPTGVAASSSRWIGRSSSPRSHSATRRCDGGARHPARERAGARFPPGAARCLSPRDKARCRQKTAVRTFPAPKRVVVAVRAVVVDRLRQVVHRLIDHGVSQRISQRVLRDDRLCRDRDDRPLASAASRAGRESHRDPDQVQSVARPVGQVVARVDAAQLVQVVQIIGVLVQHDRRLECHRRLLGRAGGNVRVRKECGLP